MSRKAHVLLLMGQLVVGYIAEREHLKYPPLNLDVSFLESDRS